MDIRSSLDGLKSLLGVTPPARQRRRPRAMLQPAGVGSAAISRPSVAREARLLWRQPNRCAHDMVSSIQAALANGSYNVPHRRGVQGGGLDAGRKPVIRV